MREEQENALITAQGSVKVEIRDLRKLFDILDISEKEKEFVRLFEQKYLELTAVRNQEKQAYDFYEKAKGLAKTAEDYEVVKDLEKEYREYRLQRMKLQAETQKKTEAQYNFFRQPSGRSR